MPKRQSARESKKNVEDFLKTAAAMAEIELPISDINDIEQTINPPIEEAEPLILHLGNHKYVTLKEWKGSKRVDIRFWRDGTVPTKDGASLYLDTWKVICNLTDIIDELLARVADRSIVDWRYHLGNDYFLTIKSPRPYLYLTKLVVYHERLHIPTTSGISLHRDEWKELKKAMPLIEEQEPELRHLVPLYRTDL